MNSISIVDIETSEVLAHGSSFPLAVELPDGGTAEFVEVGQTEPEHAPRYRADSVTWDERYEQNVNGVVSSLTWPEMKTRLLDYAGSCRLAKETGGLAVGGVPIRTDRESQAMIAGAFALVRDDPTKSIKFKTPAGFVDLDSAAVVDLARAIGDHVQACFALEANLSIQIETQNVTTYEQIDAAFA